MPQKPDDLMTMTDVAATSKPRSRAMWIAGRFVLIVACTSAVAGCGGSGGGTSSSSVSPTQFSNSQRDGAYLRAVDQSTAAFKKPPKNPTDYQTGLRELQAAIRDLNSLSVPPAFKKAQARVVAALTHFEGLGPRLERAFRADNKVALNNLEAQNVRDQSAMNAAFHEMASVYDKCSASKFAAC